MLPPEARERLQTAVTELRKVQHNHGDPGTRQAVEDVLEMAVLPALSGEHAHEVDYRSILEASQARWVIAGHVSSQHPIWAKMFPDEQSLLTGLRVGLRYEWLPEEEWLRIEELNPGCREPYHAFPMAPEQREPWRKFILAALLMGYVIPHKGAVENPCFGIEEPSKWRWILSLRNQNLFMKKIHVKMMTNKQLGEMLPRGAWCITGGYHK